MIYWTPTSGVYTYNGGDTNERYDTNVYMDKTGGDRLVIEGKSAVKVTFATTENGKVVGSPGVLNFTGIERLHLGDGNDVVNASTAKLNSAHGGTRPTVCRSGAVAAMTRSLAAISAISSTAARAMIRSAAAAAAISSKALLATT